jgi:hypothetical protein
MATKSGSAREAIGLGLREAVTQLEAVIENLKMDDAYAAMNWQRRFVTSVPWTHSPNSAISRDKKVNSRKHPKSTAKRSVGR